MIWEGRGVSSGAGPHSGGLGQCGLWNEGLKVMFHILQPKRPEVDVSRSVRGESLSPQFTHPRARFLVHSLLLVPSEALLSPETTEHNLAPRVPQDARACV